VPIQPKKKWQETIGFVSALMRWVIPEGWCFFLRKMLSVGGSMDEGGKERGERMGVIPGL